MNFPANEEKRIESNQSSITRLLFFVIGALYFGYAVFTPGQWHFIDGVDLIFHEAGHTLLPAFIFGQWIAILGGSFMQIAVPLVLMLYALFVGDRESGLRQPYTVSVVGMWLGQSFVNLSVYVGDAGAQVLPLLGGGDVVHDWNYLLSSVGLVEQATRIGSLVYFVGVSVFVCAAFYGVYSWNEKRKIVISHY